MKAEAQIAPLDAVSMDALGGLRLFANADLAAVAALLRHCPVQTLRKDRLLLTPGMVNHTLYLVLNGRLRIHLDSPETDAVQHIEVGETVGEISLVDEKLTTAFVVADTTTLLMAIDHETFWSLVDTSHAVARNMLLLVVERMRANNSLVADGMRLREQSRRQTTVDPLTGLRNAHALGDLLRRQMLRSSMGRQPLSVLMIDVDRFTQFNHDFGQVGGDSALCAVARTLQDQLRPTDIVTRVDEEKFAVLLPESDENGARIVAERLRAAIAETVIEMADDSILPPVTISIGIAEMQ